MGIPAEKVHVIPYGVRLDHFTRTEEPPQNSFEVLFAGQVSLRKGIPYLLQAFARLKHPNKHLTIAGAIQDDIRTLLSTLPTDNVVFTGPLPQAQLAKKMSASHLLVLPSVEEGLREAAKKGYKFPFPFVDVEFELHFGKYHDVDSSQDAFYLCAIEAFREGLSRIASAALV